MVDYYRMLLEEYVDLEGITERILKDILEQLGKDLIYNFFAFGKDVTFETFLNNFNIYLEIIRKLSDDECDEYN
ncbi:MAG TPA: hypothetical protein VK071_07490 [Tissierellales bacterium]|nr:hypothetical protein [Tissierellales bacterium]